jgi:HK97 family phage major capsid protein
MSGLQQTLDRLIVMRNQARSKRQAILDRAESEGREELTVDETRAIRAIAAQLEGADGEEGLDARIGFLHAEVQRGLGNDDPANAELLEALGGQRRNGVHRPGNHVAPLAFAQADVRAMFEAARTRSSYSIRAQRPSGEESRAFGSPEQYLPAQLFPGVVGMQHENRILDQIPAIGTDSPFYAFIRHNATTEDDDETPGTAGIVAEGALKPEVILQTDELVIPMLKVAVHSATSWESVSDFVQWTSYFTNELTRIVIDKENAQLLAGAGGSNAIQGLTTVSGALSHITGGMGTTPTNETPLDAIESSIAQLRTGPALAEANLLILHPETWSAIRRSKDLQDRYLVTLNPLADTAQTVWGVPVLTTTQQEAGVGTLLDTRKFGYAVVREPIVLRSGWANDDFTRNLIRFLAEERLNLSITRPAAVLNIENLPTA